MRWKKLGRLFTPEGQAPWVASHAALPWPLQVGEDRYRIYCAGRDAKGRSQVGFVDVSLTPPFKVLRVSAEPVLAPGPLGAFDDSGVMNACLVATEDHLRLYYVGITVGRTVPFRSFTGLALSQDGLRFDRFSPSPILERNEIDPFLTAASYALRVGRTWHLWYTSGVRWETVNGVPKHFYHIKHATSDDGIRWERRGTVAIDFNAGEYAIARPFVMYEDGFFKMWYSYRGDSYRIGYAESIDGMVWTRKDELAGIDVSATGWDSEMICYASVFDHGGSRYMLYNGNGYGKTGFGLAQLD